MDQTAPTVTLDSDRVITFDMATLQRIEDRLGIGVFELAGKIVEVIGTSFPPDPQGIARRMRLAEVVRFVAACVGVEADKLETIVPSRELVTVYLQLGGSFVLAISQILGGGTEDGAQEGGAEGKEQPVGETASP